jgi:hypothetical protein
MDSWMIIDVVINMGRKDSELLRWHKEKDKQDTGMIRHPADATQ